MENISQMHILLLFYVKNRLDIFFYLLTIFILIKWIKWYYNINLSNNEQFLNRTEFSFRHKPSVNVYLNCSLCRGWIILDIHSLVLQLYFKG